MKSHQQLFAELKRRKVFKVAAVYGAVAFVLLQVADLLGQGLRLPESFMPFITAVILLGFPLALILAWAFEVTPEGVQRTGAASAGEIEEIVELPLGKRWPAGLAALFGLAALLAGAWWVGTRTGPTAGDERAETEPGVRFAYADLADDPRPSLAVLPFADMSPEGDQEYFSDGITEEILNVLAKLPELRVAARTSAFAFKDRQMDLRAVGDSLGVGYLIEGSVRKSGDQLRITAQLIDARTGSHVWSDAYDRTLDNVFQVQTEIAEAIADQLRVPLGIDEPSDLVTPTADVEAYDLYLAGRARMRERGEPSLREAIRLFEAAIARDSGWAPPWASLAEATEFRLWYVNPSLAGPGLDTMTAALDRAERAARRALELDPENASAHVALGNVLRDRFEWEEAGAAYRAALAIDPDYSEAHHGYSELLLVTGRSAEAVQSAARAAALDPAPIMMNMLGWALMIDGREAEAIRAYEKGISLDPDGKLESARRNLGLLHYDAERYDEAHDLWVSAPGARQEMDGWSEWVRALRKGTLAAVPDTARQYLEPEDLVHLGEPDMAANALANPPHPDWIGHMYRVWAPIFDPIRGHPAVRGYLRDRGLEGVTVQRTPPAERELPAVLRTIPGEAAP